MTVTEWQRLKLLFDEARQASSEERSAILAGEAANPEVLSELQSLLQAYDESPDFLDSPSPDGAPLAGRRLGPWVLDREIGRGGMGVVWEAHRADREYEQKAAVKLLACGLLSAVDIARFREERQILARLNHPGIARLLDGGTAEDGSPYIVMEFIEGERLDEWCAAHNPSLRQRISIFRSICAAVDYAHQRLVIHRDLKPANILMTAAADGHPGLPKLLDFGIARLLEPGSAAQGATETGARLLTPQYASPERIRGEPATTATDIYSLGVVLYVLLTGRQPYTCGPDDPLELMRAICESDVPAPSTVPGTPRELRGELDAIILQCLRKSPEERYPSLRALADDLQAWLDGRPVSAHVPSPWRRALKAVRRHRAGSAAAAVALCGVLGGSAVSLWYARESQQEKRRAEMRFDQVRRLAHTVIFDFHDAIQYLPGSTPARRMLIDQALQYLKDLESTGGATRELYLEMAAAYVKVGGVLGDLGRSHLGNTQAAMEAEQHARRLALQMLGLRPGDAEARHILILADEDLSRLSALQGRSREARAFIAEAADMRWKEVAADPGRPELEGRAYLDMVHGYTIDENWTAAITAGKQAVDLFERALSKGNQPDNVARDCAYGWDLLADAHKESGDLESALACYREAGRRRAELAAALPGDTRLQMEISFDLVDGGWIEYSLGRYNDAIANYEKALAIQQKLSAADPQDYWARTEYGKLLNTAAFAFEAAGRRTEAIRMYRDAAARLEEAREHDPRNVDTQYHVAWVWSNLGDLYTRAGESAGGSRLATDCYQRAHGVLKSLDRNSRIGVLHLDPSFLDSHVQKQLAAGPGRWEITPLP